MPYNNYNAILYNAGMTTKVKMDSVTINDNLWLGNISNIWCGNYRYTSSKDRFEKLGKSREKMTEFIKSFEPCVIAERYKMRNFIFNNQDNDIEYSKGTIWIGGGGWQNNQNKDSVIGKIDIQSAIRSICREEIEYALWNYTSKLIENNQDNQIVENLIPSKIDNFRLTWFYNSKFPIKDITLNGFRVGTDDTEFKPIKNNINLKKKIFLE